MRYTFDRGQCTFYNRKIFEKCYLSFLVHVRVVILRFRQNLTVQILRHFHQFLTSYFPSLRRVVTSGKFGGIQICGVTFRGRPYQTMSGKCGDFFYLYIIFFQDSCSTDHSNNSWNLDISLNS